MTGWGRALGLVLVGVWLVAGCAPDVPTARPSSVPPANPLAVAPPPSATATPLRLVLNWTAPTAAQSPLWVAQDLGIFREQGLTVDLVNVSGTSRVLQSMMAGEIQLSPLDPAATVEANLGGADAVLLFGVQNRLPFAIWSQPAVTDPQALRGKSLGVTRVGASSHTAGLVALKRWGLEPDRDVALRQLGEVTAIYAALEAGQIDAGVLTLPVPARMQARYRQLIHLPTEGPEYPSVAIGGPRAWVEANPETVRRFARAYVVSIARARVDKDVSIAAYRKYMHLDDPEQLEATFADFRQAVAPVPYVSETGLESLLQSLAEDDPRLAEHSASEYVDSHFVRELDDSGFIRQLVGNVQ